MRRIIALSVTFRVLVAGAAALLMTAGVLQLRHARVEAYPQFTPPYVQVQTEAPGLSAAEVEQLVTVPLEQDLLNGIPWLDQMRSASAPGLSAVDLVFQPGTDLLHARQAVNERLTQARALPNVGTPPTMIAPLSSTSRAVMIALSSKELSPIELSTLARWKIRPRLLGVPGVAGVVIWGQRDRQLQVQVDPERLRSRKVELEQVVTTTGNALWASPLTFVEASTPGTGGFIDTSNQRFSIQHVLPITRPKDLAAVSVEGTGGTRLTLGDVSTVVQGNQPMIGDAVLGTGPGVMLVVQQFPDADTRKLTQAVEEAMDTLRPGLSGVTVDTTVYREASYLDTALRNLGWWALTAVILVPVLLAVRHRSWRAVVVGFAAFTLSLVTAAYLLYLRGASFNLMVLAGVAVALGAVIDDAVTDVPQIRRRLREHRRSGDGRPAADVVVAASAAARGPALYATLIALLAAVPLLSLGGVDGAFARPLALSYALAVAAAAVVALVLTPALGAFLLPGERAAARPAARPGPFARRLSRSFDATARALAGRPGRLAGTVGVLAAAGLAVLPQLGSHSLIPLPHDRDLLVRLRAAPGTSLPEMTRVSGAMAAELRALPGVRDVGAHVGRAVVSDQTVEVNSGELWVGITPSADYAATVHRIEGTVRGYPGLSSRVLTYGQDQVDAVGSRHGTTAPVVVRVYGQDLGTLRAKAEEVRAALAGIPGVVRARVPLPAEEPTVEVTVDLHAAQRHGLKPGDVRRAAATVFYGLPVGSFYQDQQIYDVVVQGTPQTRSSPDKVRDLLLATPGGGQVRLGDVASVRIAPYPTIVRHDATSRSLDVDADVRGRDLDSVLHDVRGRVQHIAMPYEYHAETLSDVAAQQSRDLRTAVIAGAVVAGIFLVFQAAFGSWRLAALALLTLPLAPVGGILTAFLVGGVMSAGALAGLLLVAVLAVRAMVPIVRDLQASGPTGPEQAAEAVRQRAGSVLFTTAVTAAVLLWPAVAGQAAGFEVLHPLAVVALGGLVSQALLTLVVVPALYPRMVPAPPPADAGRGDG